MFTRSALALVLALLTALPAAAQEYKNGLYAAVTFGPRVTKWQMQLKLEDKKVSGKFSRKGGKREPIDYHCSRQSVQSLRNFSLNCSLVGGSPRSHMKYVDIIGSLSSMRATMPFSSGPFIVDFTLLNERDFKAYRRFAATNENAGTNKFLLSRYLAQNPRGKPLPQRKTARSELRKSIIGCSVILGLWSLQSQASQLKGSSKVFGRGRFV